MQNAELLRFAFAQGPGRTIVADALASTPPVATTSEQQPPGLSGELLPLPSGVSEALLTTPFPHGRPIQDGDKRHRWSRLIVAGFGLQRREPLNVYNDHRACPSVRSKFPVHVYSEFDGRSSWFDAYQNALIPVAGDAPPPGTRLILAGRYSHLPDFYQRLRGPLVDLELGVNLRALAVALELFGYHGRLLLPSPEARHVLARLGLRPEGEWALPLVVEAAERDEEIPGVAGAGQGPFPAPELPVGGPAETAMLRTVVEANRACLDAVPRAASADGAAEVCSAIPRHASAPGPSWGKVFFERSSGRVPPHVSGMMSRRRILPREAALDLAAWLAIPPPDATLRAVSDLIAVTVTLQGVAGLENGVYRLLGGNLTPVEADSAIMAKLQACYGVGIAPDFDSGIRNSSFVVTFSVNVGQLVRRFGAAAWTFAQYCAGWMVQGGSLAATAHGLYARPSRAFEDLDTQRVLGLPDGELTLLSLLCGTSRFSTPVLDLRV